MVTLEKNGRLEGYRIDSLLAVGGFAKIYRGLDLARRRRVAIKVPITRYRLYLAVEDFRHEVRENRKLNHPNVLPVLDFFVTKGIPVIVMPLGRASLADRISTRLPLRRVLRYTHDMLLGLAHAHRRHVLHLDVKPENLIVSWSGRVALADFGTARRGHRTVVGDCAGTAGYMAPEQADGHPSARSDVYAAGVVIREMLWGRSSRRFTRRGVPERLLALVERATEVEAHRRYPDAAAMLADLRRIERQRDARTRPEHGRSRSARRVEVGAFRGARTVAAGAMPRR